MTPIVIIIAISQIINFQKQNFQNIISKTEFVMLVVVPLEACFGVKPTARRQGAELASGK